jgi:hypothetical protein
MEVRGSVRRTGKLAALLSLAAPLLLAPPALAELPTDLLNG